MIPIDDLVGHFAWTLLALTAPFAVPGFTRFSYHMRALVMTCAAMAAWTPLWRGESAVFYARGIVGDLSPASLVLFTLLAARGLGYRSGYTKRLPRDVSAFLFVLFGLLYLCSLGYIPHDLYAWGYEPRAQLVAVGLMLAYAWWRHPGMAVAWIFSLAAFALGILPSVNLWDALGDPILWLGGAWFACVAEQGDLFARSLDRERTLPLALRAA